jgi:hypothetical protein
MCKADEIKINFENHFRALIEEEIVLRDLIFEIFIYGTAYVVGGFFRDFLNNQRSRDVDIIVDIKDKNILLLDIVKALNYPFETNRHGGIKLKLNRVTVDLWDLENNWAFKEQLVKLNEEDKLNSIAKGCFFNYDSLVINLHNFSYNLRYYNEFKNKQVLDILLMKPSYKNLNPTTEANILRAIFIKNKFKIEFTENTLIYLIYKLGSIRDSYQDELQRLLDVKQKYPKYNDLSESILRQEIHLLLNNKTMRQMFLPM